MRTARWIVAGCLLLFALQLAMPGRAAPTPRPALSRLTLVEQRPPRTLDPGRVGDTLSMRHVSLMYETLLEYTPFGEHSLQPCLAQSMPSWDGDECSYTFKLRDDVRFADDPCFADGRGRKLTAEDVVFSIKRLAALPDSRGYWMLQGKLKGLDAFRDDALKLAKIVKHDNAPSEVVLTPEWWKHVDHDVAGLKALDDATVQFTLNAPYPQLLQVLAQPSCAIVAKEAAKKYDLAKHPVGTGPYVLKQSSDDLLVYERNPHYRAVRLRDVPKGHPLKRFEGARLPLTDVLRFEIEPDAGKAFQKFLDGFTPVASPDLEQFAQVMDEDAFKAGKRGDELLKQKYLKQGIHLQQAVTPRLHYISFNMNDRTFGKPAGAKGAALRKAVALSIDRGDYINTQLEGRGVPADQLLPPGILGHSDDCVLTNQHHDPAAGRKLLKAAGFTVTKSGNAWVTTDAAGKQLELQVSFRSTSDAIKAFADWLAKSLANVGLKLKPEYMTFADFLRTQDEGKGQAYDAGWVMDYPDAQNMLQLLYGPNKPPGINSAGYESADYDKLYEELASLREEVPKQAAHKKELVAQMHKLIDEDTPWVLFEFRQEESLYHEGYLRPPYDPFASNLLKYAYWVR